VIGGWSDLATNAQCHHPPAHVSDLSSNARDVFRSELRLEAADMFHHAYNAYMARAWPADELMPLSCRYPSPAAYSWNYLNLWGTWYRYGTGSGIKLKKRK